MVDELYCTECGRKVTPFLSAADKEFYLITKRCLDCRYKVYEESYQFKQEDEKHVD